MKKTPAFIKWIESLFYKASPSSLYMKNNSSNVRAITMLGDPEEYDSFVKTLLSLQKEGGDEIILKKLYDAQLELLLEPLDWLKLFTINQPLKKNMIFKVNEKSLADVDIKKIMEPLNTAVKLPLASNVDFFDGESLSVFFTSCLNNGLVAFSGNVVHQHITVLSILGVLEAVMSAVEHSDPKSYKQMRKIKDDLKAFTQTEARESVDDLVDAIKEKRSVFSTLENSRKLSPGSSLLDNMLEIVERAKSLEPDLRAKVAGIAKTSKKLINDDWDSLTQEEKITFKVTIEKDLPSLIFNYLSLPTAMRSNLVEKGTDISVSNMLGQSLDKIQNDFNNMDKSQIRHEASLNSIKSTSKYLHNRS